MRIPEEAHIPESIRTGPLANILFGREDLNALNQMNLGSEDVQDLVTDFLDNIQEITPTMASSNWSQRKERSIKRTLQYQTRVQAYYTKLQAKQWRLIDPTLPTTTTNTDGIKEYRLTSVLRKRKKKMNKHKHRKLRKRTKALRKRLGK